MKYPSITELVLRDGQQSLIATRMRLSDMTPILSKLDNVGFSSLEVWGGATYDCCLRFLNEDPWERLKVIKSNVKKTQLQMLLRGKNLVGYKKYDCTVIDLFIKKSSENGIDIFRIFDALNDINNIAYSLMIKEGRDLLIYQANTLQRTMKSMGKKYKNISMLSHTHGQPASPTTMGKEFINFYRRLDAQINDLSNI